MLTTLDTEIMSSPVVTVTVDRPVSEATRTMLNKNIGSLAVIDESGKFVGSVYESKYFPGETVLSYLRQSVLPVLGSELGDSENLEEVIEKTRNTLVGDALRKDAPTISSDTHLGEIAK